MDLTPELDTENLLTNIIKTYFNNLQQKYQPQKCTGSCCWLIPKSNGSGNQVKSFTVSHLGLRFKSSDHTRIISVNCQNWLCSFRVENFYSSPLFYFQPGAVLVRGQAYQTEFGRGPSKDHFCHVQLDTKIGFVVSEQKILKIFSPHFSKP